MKLDKVIGIQTAMRDKTHVYTCAEINKALSLGIEALKRVKKSRDKKFPVQGEKLPGETED